MTTSTARRTRPYDWWYDSKVRKLIVTALANINKHPDITLHNRIKGIYNNKTLYYFKHPRASAFESYKFPPPDQHHVEILLCKYWEAILPMLVACRSHELGRRTPVRFDPDTQEHVVPTFSRLMEIVERGLPCRRPHEFAAAVEHLLRTRELQSGQVEGLAKLPL